MSVTVPDSCPGPDGFPLTYCYRPRERESRNKEVHDSAR